jgi:hypothetical protein
MLACVVLNAQQGRDKEARSTFGLSILAGTTLSQVDGDNYRGYNNAGLYAGLRGITRVSNRFEMHLELLYSQKGSKFESRQGPGTSGKRERHIKLDYAEIPVLAAYRVTRELSGTHIWIEGGMSIARLIDSRVQDSPIPSEEEFSFSEIEDEFKKTDFSVIAGIVVNPTPWLGLGVRGTWGITRFYEDEHFEPSTSSETVEFLRNYTISAFAMYHF